jgi:hypothetical protein
MTKPTLSAINDLISKATTDREMKINRFIRDALKIKKLSFWTKLKLKLQGVRIERQYLGECRESVKIYRREFLTDGAEFNVLPTFEEFRFEHPDLIKNKE